MTARTPAAKLSPAAALIHEAAPHEQESFQDSRRWRAMEASITLGILLIVVMSVADSIAAADWVDSIPDVRVTALLAMVVAFGFSRPSVHWLAALVGGLILGAIVVFWQVLEMPQFDGQSWFWERFTDLRFRLEDWFRQAFNDGITTDNIPFVFGVVLGIWVATFPTTLLVLRRRNPWPLVILLGIALSINVSYLSGKQWDFHFAIFAAGAALLVMRTNLLTRMARWRQRGTPFPDFISSSFLAVTIIGVAGLMLVSRAAPRPDRAEPLTELWGGITAPFSEMSLEFERLFGGIDSQRGAPIHNFSANFILQGDINPGQGIVVRVDAPEVGLLRGATYDRYTTRGWQQSAIDTGTAPEGASFSGEEESSYEVRREVTIRLSVEQSPRVLFTFGLPTAISREVTVDQTTPGRVTLDIENRGAGAPAELVEVARAIADREEAGESFPADLIPAGWVPVGSEVSDDGTLLALELESRPAEPDVLTLRPDDTVRAGFTYEVRGSVSAATVEQLQGAGSEYPYWTIQRYLQLPSDLDDEGLDRLRRFATAVTASAESPYDVAALIEGYLCCTPIVDANGAPILNEDGEPRPVYPFTTDLPLPPPRADAVTWWLLDNVDDAGLPIGGYYDYHASAMAVLLRSMGIPARVSTGYVLTEDNFDDRTRTFIVRGKHAYSWVEVFFPGYGWVDFDPTPPVVSDGTFSAIAGERIAAQRLRPFASDVFDDSENPFGIDALSELEDLLLLEDVSSDLLPDTAGPAGEGFSWWLVGMPLIALAAVMAVGGTGVAAWRFSLRGKTPVERAWTSTQRLARWGGLRVDPADTPREYAGSLGVVVRDPESTQRLADSYTRERFGAAALSESEVGEARLAWRSLRGRLLRRALRLPVPATPADDAEASAEEPPSDDADTDTPASDD